MGHDIWRPPSNLHFSQFKNFTCRNASRNKNFLILRSNFFSSPPFKTSALSLHYWNFFHMTNVAFFLRKACVKLLPFLNLLPPRSTCLSGSTWILTKKFPTGSDISTLSPAVGRWNLHMWRQSAAGCSRQCRHERLFRHLSVELRPLFRSSTIRVHSLHKRLVLLDMTENSSRAYTA